MTLFHGAFCSAHLFGQNRFWPIMTCFRDILTFFGFVDFKLFGPCCSSPPFSSPRLCCASLIPASPALQGGKFPLTSPASTLRNLPGEKTFLTVFGTSQVENGLYITQNACKQVRMTLFHAAFYSAHLFGQKKFWSIWTFFGTFSLSAVFWISAFWTF